MFGVRGLPDKNACCRFRRTRASFVHFVILRSLRALSGCCRSLGVQMKRKTTFLVLPASEVPR
jgi:hypothetical protein